MLVLQYLCHVHFAHPSYDLLNAWEKKNLVGYEKKFTDKFGHRADRVYQLNQEPDKFFTVTCFMLGTISAPV